MKPLHILLIAITCLFFSCEKEAIEVQEEANLTQTITTSTRSNIKRTRLKERRNGLYKTVMVIEDDPNNEVATIELTMPPQNGFEPNPTTMTLLPKNTNANGNTRFVFKQLSIEGEDPIGQPIEITVTQKNAQGETIGEPETSYVTAQGNDDLNINKPTLKNNEDGETFTFRVVTRGAMVPEVSNVSVHLTPDDGGSDADPEEFDLELVSETATKRVFKAQSIEFIDSGNVVDMEYIAAITLTDVNGEELDYAEFRIVGLEQTIPDPEPNTTAFGEPSLNFFTDFQQFGITIPVNGPNSFAVNDVFVKIEPIDADASPTINSEIIITEFEETPTGLVFYAFISFEDPENVIGKQYSISVEDWECENTCLEHKIDNTISGALPNFELPPPEEIF